MADTPNAKVAIASAVTASFAVAAIVAAGALGFGSSRGTTLDPTWPDGDGTRPAGWGPCMLDDEIILHANGGLWSGSPSEIAVVQLGAVASFEAVLGVARRLYQHVVAEYGEGPELGPRAEAKETRWPGVALFARGGAPLTSLDALRELVRTATDVPTGCGFAGHVSVVPDGHRWFMPVFHPGARYTVRLAADDDEDDRVARVQTLSVAPLVFRIGGLLSSDECDHILALRGPANATDADMLLGREAGWGRDGAAVDSVTDRVQKRAARLTGLDPARYTIEHRDRDSHGSWRRDAEDDASFFRREVELLRAAQAHASLRLPPWRSSDGEASTSLPSFALHQDHMRAVRFPAAASRNAKRHTCAAPGGNIGGACKPPAAVPAGAGAVRRHASEVTPPLLSLLIALSDHGGAGTCGAHFPLAFNTEAQRVAREAQLEAVQGDAKRLAHSLHLGDSGRGACNASCSLKEGDDDGATQEGGAVFRLRKGEALLVYSLDAALQSAGVPDWRSLHCGCGPEASGAGLVGAGCWMLHLRFRAAPQARVPQRLAASHLLERAAEARFAGRAGMSEAVAHVRAALALVPQHTHLHMRVGSLLHAAGRDDEALHHFRAAVQHHPRDYQSHYGMGRVLGRLGRAEEAVASFESALAQEPPADDPFFARVLGAAVAAAEQWAEAESSRGANEQLALAQEFNERHAQATRSMQQLMQKQDNH